jgi:hypothetical protein
LSIIFLASAADADTNTDSKKVKQPREFQGQGRINGVEIPVAVVRGGGIDSLLRSLKASYLNKATVKIENSTQGLVVVVSNMRSPECPTCIQPTPENVEEIIKSGKVFTLFSIGSHESFAIGTSVGSLMDAGSKTRGNALVYEGVLQSSVATINPVTQSTFKFEDQVVQIFSGESVLSPQMVRSAIEADLQKQGYKLMDHLEPSATSDLNSKIAVTNLPEDKNPEKLGNAKQTKLWRRGDDVLQVRISKVFEPSVAISTNVQTIVEIYESSNKK